MKSITEIEKLVGQDVDATSVEMSMYIKGEVARKIRDFYEITDGPGRGRDGLPLVVLTHKAVENDLGSTWAATLRVGATQVHKERKDFDPLEGEPSSRMIRHILKIEEATA